MTTTVPKQLWPLLNGIDKVASAQGFKPFHVLWAEKDPQVDGVYLCFIEFKEDGKWGLCIWSTQEVFIEEPDDLAGYGYSGIKAFYKKHPAFKGKTFH